MNSYLQIVEIVLSSTNSIEIVEWLFTNSRTISIYKIAF